MVEINLGTAIKMAKELVDAVETLRKENSRIADKNLYLQSEVDNLKKKVDIDGNRVDQLLTENDTLAEALKNAREQLKECEHNFDSELECRKEKEAANSELYRLLNNTEKEKCALCEKVERLEKENELFRNGCIEELIKSCSFELKFNIREDE